MNRFFILCLFLQQTICVGASNEIEVNQLIRKKGDLPAIEAFEHFNLTGSHLFPQAKFKGSYTGNNRVKMQSSSALYPSGSNMAYLDEQHLFIYGVGSDDKNNREGAFIARVDPKTLEPIWFNQLDDTNKNGEWNFPGSMGILKNGLLYVVHGYHLSKIDPASGAVHKKLILPTPGGARKNIAYDGFTAAPDGTLIVKSLYREANCQSRGTEASENCFDPTVLVSVDPDTMEVIDKVFLSVPVLARPTIAEYKGQTYLYLVEAETLVRYVIEKGKFTLDTTWQPGTITLPGQTNGSSFSIMNDWVIGQVNALPSPTALSVIAIHQADAARQYSIQPFYGDPISSSVSSVFSKSTPGGKQAISWAPASISVDPANHQVYITDSIVGLLAAVRMTTTGLITLWKAEQRTTELMTLIGPEKGRILVGTDIPDREIPGKNESDYVVWRSGLTGEELARSTLLPAITQGTMIQPYYSGGMFYESQSGKLIKLEPIPKKRKN